MEANVKQKDAFFKISYGMYIIGSVKDGMYNGQIANSLFQVTSEPETIAISINRQNYTYEFIRASKVFSVSVLSEDAPMALIGHFGFRCGRDFKKFEGIRYKTGHMNVPLVLEHTVACFEVEVVKEMGCGTHSIFFGNATSYEKFNDDPPMTYAYYHLVKGGKSPKLAPTYIKEEPKKEKEKSATYECSVCGYLYDPSAGDPDHGVKPSAAFEDLPEGWSCPVCGAKKDSFNRA